MSKMSRDKGKRGELEVAAIMRSHGFEARRGQQRRGGGDSPDVIHNIPNLYVEVKLREQFNLYAALEKATQEAFHLDTPVVFHRRKRKNWLVTMDADDFLILVKKLKRANHNEFFNTTQRMTTKRRAQLHRLKKELD